MTIVARFLHHPPRRWTLCHCSAPATAQVILRDHDGRQSVVPVCDKDAKPWRDILAAHGGRYVDFFGRVVVRVDLVGV